MPVTYLKGAGAAIGRGMEAFEAQQGQQASGTASNIAAAVQSGRYTCVILLHCIFISSSVHKQLKSQVTVCQ